MAHWARSHHRSRREFSAACLVVLRPVTRATRFVAKTPISARAATATLATAAASHPDDAAAASAASIRAGYRRRVSEGRGLLSSVLVGEVQDDLVPRLLPVTSFRHGRRHGRLTARQQILARGVVSPADVVQLLPLGRRAELHEFTSQPLAPAPPLPAGPQRLSQRGQ